MSVISILSADDGRVIPMLKAAAEKLDGAGAETVLDFSSVRRFDADSLRALHEFVHVTEAAQSRVTIRGLNVDAYKTLKLANLAGIFLFSD